MRAVDTQKLFTLVEPVVAGQGYELVDLEWKHEAGVWVLRVYIDRQAGAPPKDGRAEGPVSGISLDDCAGVSRQLSAELDVSDALHVAYTLEVSSPGLDRPLRRESDFRRFVGRKARIRTRNPVGESRRNFSGTLIAVEAGKVRIDVGGQTFDVPVEDVEKANLIYELKA